MFVSYPMISRFFALWAACFLASLHAQVTTPGFLNLARPEAPGTLLSHPLANDSEATGRTTSINYLNGWVIVGAEAPGSRPGSDLALRVYDLSDPANPIRRRPSDFLQSLPNNQWYQGNFGWNAHGTAQTGNLLLPQVMRISSFGAPVERGGSNGIPDLGQVGVGYNRSAQAGPWVASFPWYGSADEDFTIERVTTPYGYNEFQTLATFDHVGPYGGGDWHPMFFGDLLIYARSGGSARDGVVVYRLQYNNFDNPVTRSVTPQFVGALAGGFQGYWPTLFSDGSGLYVVGSSSNILIAADITRTTDPTGDGEIPLAASLTVPNFTNASYPVYQDNFGFIHNRKVDMTRFLAGDANPIVLTLNEGAPNRVNTSQMSLALGNLWLTGGYPQNHGTANYEAQGMAVWVHQQAPDTAPPRVTYHLPQAGRTSYPRHAPLSFLIPEHPRRGGPRNGIDFAVRPVSPGTGGAPDTLGAAVNGYLIHDFSGVLTFTPSAGLAANTTYQVDFFSDNQGTPANLADDLGFQDAAGNLIEPYTFRFSTGGGINAVAPPVVTSLVADTFQPGPGNVVTVTATATGTGPLEYRFNFDGVWSAWSATPSDSHVYAVAGRPRVLVQVRDNAGNLSNGSLRLLVLAAPAPGPRPTQSSTLAIGDDPDGRRLWVVNPDAHTVSVLDADTGTKLAEHSTGAGSNPRSIARDASGRYWVSCHGTDQLRVLMPDGSLHTTITLPYGAAPFGIAPSPNGQSLFVTLHGSGRLLRYSAASPAAAPVARDTFPTPRALAVSADGSRVLVTRFISSELEAEIGEFAGTSPDLALTRTFRLSSANTIDGGDRAAGVPNYLAGIAISPDGTRAAIVSKQDNIQRGLLYGVSDLTHETTVRAVVSFLDLISNQEIRDTRRDFDNSESPSAVTYSPLGDTLLVALQGNNRVAAIDALSLAPVSGYNTTGSTETSPAVISFELDTGLAPQGLLVDGASKRLFTQNFMGRSVSVRDAGPLLDENRTTLPLLATTETVAVEPLAANVLLGKQIFYNAADPRMSADSYISCASCHVDGGSDGRVWDFTGRGEGLRRTTDLRGRSGMVHGNVHWSANFDEIQDFEHDIRGPFGGTGFLPLTPGQFASQHPSPATGKAGLSSELDALAAYVRSLGPESAPRSPVRNPNGSLSAAALAGRAVFNAQSCTSCHTPDHLTDSLSGSVSSPFLHDVGTLSTLSGMRLGGPLTGIDTPTLHGLHATRSYLHGGQAETLTDVFGYAGGVLHPAAGAELVGLAAGAISHDEAGQGGGGFLRGALGGSLVQVTGAATNAVRFTNIDGGTSGGTARLAIRHAKQYGSSTGVVVVNGVSQNVTYLRQYPDNSWMLSGWRWVVVEANLNPGVANTIELRRGNGDVPINALLVSNADDLATANPHRRVLALPLNDRDNLLVYLRSLDARDDAGVPLAPPAQAPATAPGIVTAPSGQVLATGNPLALFVAVSGTGPFTFVWRRDTTPVGGNSPVLEIPAVGLGDAGAYTVTITNAVDEITTTPVAVTVNPTLAITSSVLPRATVGRAYTFDFSAIGGVSGRTWSLVTGALPTGLVLSTTGQLTGNPTAAARADFTVRVADTSGFASRAFALEVRPTGGFSTDPDLILHYTFDEGSGNQVWDASPQGNNHSTELPVSNQWVANGRFGGAYGPSDLSAGIAPFFPANQSDLDFNSRADAFTISVWVRTTTTDGYRTILSKNGFADESWNVQYRLWSVNPATSLQGVSGNAWSGGLATGPAAPLNNGQWQLVTLVNYYDAPAATWRSRVYYNGGSNYTQWNSGNTTVSRQLRIGDTTNGYNGWNGQLDDLRIYKRALTPAEIDALYAPAAAAMNYDNWLATVLVSVPAMHASPFSDPDSDNLVNLLEYALGGDPMTGDRLDEFLVASRVGGRMRLSFTRLRADLRYKVEGSFDLSDWQTIATDPGVLGVETTVTDSELATPGGSRFLRLGVEER